MPNILDREPRERRPGAIGNQPRPHPIAAAVRGVPKIYVAGAVILLISVGVWIASC